MYVYIRIDRYRVAGPGSRISRFRVDGLGFEVKNLRIKV